MKRILLVAGFLLATPLALGACNLKCKYNVDCYNCVSGGHLEDCFLDCEVCGGTRCFDFAAGMAGGEPGPEFTAPEPLLRFATKPLATAIDPAVAQVMDWFWRWHDLKSRSGMAAPLHLEGGVVIDHKPHDFTIEVRQEGTAQIYDLQVQSFAKVTLTVNPPAGGRQEVEYEILRTGQDRPRAGFVMLEAQ